MRLSGIAVVLAIVTVFITVSKVKAEESCLMCHSDLSEGKSVHNAVQAGCLSCHISIDASEIPHKIKGQIPKGLIAEPPDLCYEGCHDKAAFSAPTTHAPVGVGLCTTCHNPHRSENERLLTAGRQVLCLSFNCHDKGKFTGQKSTHKPVQEGMCLECHAPHASSNQYLVLKKGNILCRKCHPTIEKTPHALVGFKAGGHPLRGAQDPQRKGKTFGCISCHVPHTSQWGRLFRYKAESMYELCIYCHEI